MKRRTAIVSTLAALASPAAFLGSLNAAPVREYTTAELVACSEAITKVMAKSHLLFSTKLGLPALSKVSDSKANLMMNIEIVRTDLGKEFFALIKKKDFPGIIEFSKKPVFSDGQ